MTPFLLSGHGLAAPLPPKPLLPALMTLLVISLFVQIELVEIAARSLTAYHVVACLGGLILLLGWTVGRGPAVSRQVALALGFTGSLAAPALLGWDLGLASSVLGFALVFYLFGLRFGRTAPEARARIYAIAALVFFIATLGRNLLHAGELPRVYSRLRGCEGCFLAPGGRNIEATLLATLALLYQGRHRHLFALMMTATVLLYESRVGLIGAGIYWIDALLRSRLPVRRLAPLIAGIAAATLLLATGPPEILARFSLSHEITLGNEGLGRLALWSAAVELIPAHPFGVGPGQAVGAINRELIRSFWENNVHNVALTWLLDLGWLHGAALSVFVLGAACLAGLGPRQPESAALIFLTLAGLVGLSGYDAPLFFCLGTFVAARARQASAASAAATAPRSAEPRITACRSSPET
ncbi:O-antigen ligase family protein [Pseudoroseicyclus sp. CXY001]|uniref:O-antigen ligase family protein n=1 Tax=Pseudoroseicyclus sp. CXY001 TaxID=3242492 RepID=UPI003570E073